MMNKIIAKKLNNIKLTNTNPYELFLINTILKELNYNIIKNINQIDNIFEVFITRFWLNKQQAKEYLGKDIKKYLDRYKKLYKEKEPVLEELAEEKIKDYYINVIRPQLKKIF